MPYIAVELDAKKLVPHVARAVALPEHQVGWGLVCLWEWCWSEKTDAVHPGHLAGFFAHDGHKMAAALEAFGFLEPTASGYRVRGADRYLRVNAQKSLAGKSRASGQRTKRGTFAASAAGAPLVPPLDQRPSEPPAASQRPASGQPALSPTTDDRAPTIEYQGVAPGEFRDRMDAIFAEERQGARPRWLHDDENAVAELLGLGDYETIYRFWRNGLRRKAFPRVNRVAELAKHWNACAVDPTEGQAKGAAWTHDRRPDDPAVPTFGLDPGETKTHGAWRAAKERGEDAGPEPLEPGQVPDPRYTKPATTEAA